MFGDTRLMVSRIGLGMAALGRPGYINLGHAQDLARNYDVQAMEQRAYEVLDAARMVAFAISTQRVRMG
jgi:aryl-alcohol dehydrogenase-like predicted oxidoreductase